MLDFDASSNFAISKLFLDSQYQSPIQQVLVFITKNQKHPLGENPFPTGIFVIMLSLAILENQPQVRGLGCVVVPGF